MKNIIIYPGRFQPFGQHHFKSYQWLTKVFGSENVFIATSNHTDVNSPLTFEEKKYCILQYEINEDKVIQVKNPYKSEEITSKFNPTETSVIFAYGQKDFGRIKFQKADGSPSYFQEYYGQKNLKPLSQCGYVLELPHISLQLDGKELSGTYLRETLPMATQDEFRSLMGYYDESIHFLFKQKFHPDITEIVTSILKEDSNRITKTQLQRIEQYADKIFKEFGIDVNFQNLASNTHFFQRLNDPRNIEPITSDELRQLFRKASLRYGHKLSKSNNGLEAVLKDMESDINLPFMIKVDFENEELDLVPKTIMRKKNFSSTSPILAMEDFKAILQNKGKFTKHIIHPFELSGYGREMFLKIINDIFTKPLNCSLKLDGHNYQVTWDNGQVLASRNKSTIINPMTIDEVHAKYEGKENAQVVFVNAHRAIAEHLASLNDSDFIDQIFNPVEGRTFLNFEIIHPQARNVMDYGSQPYLSLHSLITYDESGNEISRTNEVPIEFESLKEQRNGFFIQITKQENLRPNPELAKKFSEKFKTLKEGEEKLFWFNLGNEVIKSYCQVTKQPNYNKTVVTKLLTKVRNICRTEDEKLKFKNCYANLQRVGGIEAINPIEGLVIEWNGNLIKLVGTFGLLQPIFRIYNNYRFKKV